LLYKELHPEDTVSIEEDITIVTLENMCLTRKYNDSAFTVGNKLIVLTEHQSTINYNMPFRMLLYLSREYDKRYGSSECIYKKNVMKIPAPELYVVYTGNDKHEEELKLSSAFETESDFLELKVKVITEETEEKEKSKSITKEYIDLVKKLSEAKKIGIKAMEDVIEEFKNTRYLISDFLERRSDVMSLFTTEYDPEVEKRVLIEEAKEEGMANGMEKERNKIIFNMHTKGFGTKEISSIVNENEAVVEKVIGEAMAGK
jgi:hypothetical protein